MQTIKQFIAANGLSMTVERTDANPHMADSAAMDHWRCVIRAGKKRMTVPFSMGRGHHGKAPTLADVLDCLASDAASVENATDFADWCSEFGLDSRKAEHTFKVTQRQTARLRRLLTDSAYQSLLWDSERL